MASFLVQLQTCGLTVFQKGLYHRRFSIKILSFKEHIFTEQSARLLLIFCGIFDLSLALSVINQFSQSMEI